MTPAVLDELAQAFDLTEADIDEKAERLVREVKLYADRWKSSGWIESEAESWRFLRFIARQNHIELPPKKSIEQTLNRLTDPRWWRGQLRKGFRAVERREVARGAVHCKASAYVSPKALQRHKRNQRRLTELLSSLEVLNVNTGEVTPLEDIVAKSQANPSNRRKALMARIAGVDRHWKGKGRDALMVTITCPSRMHPRRFKTGAPNGRFDGTEPRRAQAHLNKVWRGAMRQLAYQGIDVSGLRTVEPHHDSCPHWHVLMFVAPEHTEAMLSTLSAHAMADSPDEKGAAEHRFNVERIDPAVGSAVGYVAKYVSKALDGEGLDGDTESAGGGKSTAVSVSAWARLWGIRQFQFFGLPPITPTRELYRLKGQNLGSAALNEASEACQAKDYAAYLGVVEKHDIKTRQLYEQRPSSRYAEEITKAIRGLWASAIDTPVAVSVTTRTETFCIQPRPKKHDDASTSAPWTRLNNCATPKKSTGYVSAANEQSDSPPDWYREAGRRRPPITAGPAFAVA